MKPPTIETEEFGVMKLDPATDQYEAEIDAPFLKSKRISIADEDFETGLARLRKFMAWFKENHHGFKQPLESQIQNYDLIWDDLWDELLGEDWVDAPDGFLADYLIYDSVVYRSGKLYLWVDTSGLHADHMVRVTINESMKIECCEML